MKIVCISECFSDRLYKVGETREIADGANIPGHFERVGGGAVAAPRTPEEIAAGQGAIADTDQPSIVPQADLPPNVGQVHGDGSASFLS